MEMKCIMSSEAGEGEPMANQMVKEGFETMWAWHLEIGALYLFDDGIN